MCADVSRVGSSTAPERKRGATWVQTERSAHEAWAQLVRTNQRAAALLHVLVGNMDHQAAVVASRATLAGLVGYSEATVKRAVADLRADQWIDVVQLGGKGGVNAYLVNSRVAWASSRDQLGSAAFTARVIARRDEQDSVSDTPLRRIPTLYPGERQLPQGPGEDPPSQPSIDGLEPDLPALHLHDDDALHAELERRGSTALGDGPMSKYHYEITNIFLDESALFFKGDRVLFIKEYRRRRSTAEDRSRAELATNG